MKEKPTSFCYRLSEDEYWGLLETVTANWQEKIREDLSFLPCLEVLRKNGFCFTLPGSDGKGERHPQSKTELVLLLKQRNPPLVERVRQEIGEIEREGLGALEVKVVGKEESPLSFYNGYSQRVYPDRVLNSRFLMGDYGLYFEARCQVLGEMKERRVKRKMKDQLRQYRKAIEGGVYRGLVIFQKKRENNITLRALTPKSYVLVLKFPF